MPSDLPEEALRMDRVANDVTYRRLRDALGALQNYRRGPAARLREVLFAIRDLTPIRPANCDFLDTSLACILKRSAAERAKTGTENNAGVEQVGIADDPVSETGDRFVDQRQDQAVLRVIGKAGVRRTLVRFSICPLVKTLTGFFAELACGNKLRQLGRRFAVEGGTQHL